MSSEGLADYINDVSKLNRTYVQRIYYPGTVAELRSIIKHASQPISIAGGCYSQGGQIAYRGGTVIDLKKFNKIKVLDLNNKLITVEAGATWRDVQEYINCYGLAVKVMQSYNDFSIGGSLSVNVHGRDIAYGPLIETVKNIKILCADGEIRKASRNLNSELFSAVLGGYGGLGIILEATISLTENEPLERMVTELTIDQYRDYYFDQIKDNKNLILHNADLYPDDLTKILSVGYYKTDKYISRERCGLQDASGPFVKEMLAEQLLRRVPLVKKIRPKVALKEFQKDPLCSRNFEMSYTVKSLEPLVRFPTTTILQEYFVPVDKLTDFVNCLRTTVKEEKINLLNVSIRYIPKNTESILSYAQQESFALVLYINIPNTSWGKDKAKKWTRKLIDHALHVGGVYYLPYQLYATRNQFHRAYPRAQEYLTVKFKYDPQNIFSNIFLEKYLKYEPGI